MELEKQLTVAVGMVVSLDYELTVDGDVIDSTTNMPPLEYVHGSGSIITGLERELTGMAVGESKEVVVPARDAYGEMDPEAFAQVERSMFPASFPMEIGSPLNVRDQNGRVMRAHICEIGEEMVKLDLNHPLAGKTLNFAAKIAALREATPDEVSSGRVGGGCSSCGTSCGSDCSSGCGDSCC